METEAALPENITDPDAAWVAVKLPAPPAPAMLPAPELRRLPAGTTLGRIFFRGGAHPAAWNGFRHWGPGTGRFDPHEAGPDGGPVEQARGVLYAATAAGPGALATAAAEVFQETRIIDRTGRSPWFAVWDTARSLELLDLTGLWPTRAGASQALASGPKARARAWARAIRTAFPTLDGLFYNSSMAGGGGAVALWERAGDSFPAAPRFHRALADPALAGPLERAAQALRYGLA